MDDIQKGFWSTMTPPAQAVATFKARPVGSGPASYRFLLDKDELRVWWNEKYEDHELDEYVVEMSESRYSLPAPAASFQGYQEMLEFDQGERLTCTPCSAWGDRRCFRNTSAIGTHNPER